MLVKVRYEDGKLILLTPQPDLVDGQELWIRIESSPRPILPSHALIVTIHDDPDLPAPIEVLEADAGVPAVNIPITPE